MSKDLEFLNRSRSQAGNTYPGQRWVKYIQKYLDPSTSTFKSTWIQVHLFWILLKCTWIQVQVLCKVLGYKYFQVL